MYGNSPLGADVDPVTLSREERQALRQDLSTLAARMRDILPPEFVVGSEITTDDAGPRATVAVQPPLGGVVSADYAPEAGDVSITEEECDDIVHSLAASAAIQVKQAMREDAAPVAQ